MAQLLSRLLVDAEIRVRSSGNPVHWMGELCYALGLAPAFGNPEMIDSGRISVRAAASQAEPVRAELSRLACDHLPRVWVGRAGASASTSIGNTSIQLLEIGLMLTRIAALVEALGEDLRQGQVLYQSGIDQLKQARNRYDADLHGGDPRVQGSIAQALRQMAFAASLAERAQFDAIVGLGRFAQQASAGALEAAGFGSLDAIAVASTADRVGRILNDNDARRFGERIRAASTEERNQINLTLDNCASVEERAWLVKALAAGHSMAEVIEFTTKIHSHAADPDWLAERLRPLVPARGGAWLGAPLRQSDRNTCGAMAVMLIRANSDPIYALGIATPDAITPGAMAERLTAQARLVLDELDDGGAPWGFPEALGAPPDRAASWLSRVGPGYDWHLGWPLSDPADRAEQVVGDAAAGSPSLLLVGDGYPSHYVAVIGCDHDGVVVYDPATGAVRAVAPERLIADPGGCSGGSGGSSGARAHLYATVTQRR